MTSRTTKKKHGNQDESSAEPANPHANMASEDKEVSTNRLTEKNQESNIMSAITSMREDFSVQFTGILSAIQEVKQEVKEFSDRLSNAEHQRYRRPGVRFAKYCRHSSATGETSWS